MALFKNKEEKKVPTKSSSVNEAVIGSLVGDASGVLLSPRVTEKAANATASGVYTFNIHPSANKIQVKKAVEAIYKVAPVKVRIVKIPSKVVFRRRLKGKTAAGKKAYVYLKKGDSIEFI